MVDLIAGEIIFVVVIVGLEMKTGFSITEVV
jgi:hypothetical protein